MKKIRRRLYEILEAARSDDKASEAFDLFILLLIALNMVAIILETMPGVYEAAPDFFWRFEVFSVIVFTVEYFLRLWSCTASRKYSHPVGGRIRFAFTFMALIDLMAILPFYLPFLGADFRILRGIRLFRLFRLAKLIRYSEALKSFGEVFAAKKEELLTTFAVLCLLLIFASSSVYYAEHTAQPENFPSIPATMWWSIVTLTTVGYGDVYPVTLLGKILAGAIALMGIGLFALPTGILGAAFVERLEAKKKPKKVVCPHCGEEVPQ